MGFKKSFSFILLIFFTLLTLTSNIMFGQNKQPTLITDRPDQAESAETILPGFLQFETGFLFNKNTENANLVIKSYDIANTLLRIGLGKDIELRIGNNLFSQISESSTNKIITTGIGGLDLGTKFRIIKDLKNIPNISAIINFKLPVGKINFSPKNIEPEIVLILSKDLTDIFSISANIGSERISSDDVLEYFYSLAFGISISNKIGSYIEYYGSSSSIISAVHKLDTGLIYIFKNNIQFDISTGLDLKNGTSDWFISSGFSFRLPN